MGLQILLLFVFAAVVASYPPIITSKSGPIQGKYGGYGARAFLGIPYAESPVNDLRWRPPSFKTPWTNVLNATTYGASCPQPGGFDQYLGTLDEDCLFLNIWTPHDEVKKRPVMFWIHGGGFQQGSGSEPRLNGSYMASSTGNVVVTINYRLSAIGFLTHKFLRTDDPEFPSVGNYGLLDQRFAMKWVRDNIEAFGGDPSQVTIMGESAGGFSVMYHLTMPPSYPFYHKAIIESGGFNTLPLELAESNGDVLQKHLGCMQTDPKEVIKCMRSKEWKQVINATVNTPRSGYNPVIDGYTITEAPIKSWTQGKFNNVPLLAGDVLNEGRTFIPHDKIVTEADYTQYVEGIFGKTEVAASILKEYPCSAYNASNCYYAQAEVVGDFELTCPTKVATDSIASVQGKVYGYVFEHHPSWNENKIFGAYHSSEIDFVFSTINARPSHTPEETILAHQMTAYWGNFATCSSPNTCPESPISIHEEEEFTWPDYGKGGDSIRVGLQVNKFNTIANWKEDKCAFWKKLYINRAN